MIKAMSEQPSQSPKENANFNAQQSASEQQATPEISGEALDDQRWYHDKALAIGAALRHKNSQGAETTFDTEQASKQRVAAHIRSEYAKDCLTSDERREVEDALKEVNYLEAGIKKLTGLSEITGQEEHPGISEDRRETLLHAKDKLKTKQKALDEKMAEIPAIIEFEDLRAQEEMNQAVDRVMAPLERLYDNNPALFTEMPTGEFMKLSKEFSALEAHVERVQNDLLALQEYCADLNDSTSLGDIYDPEYHFPTVEGACEFASKQIINSTLEALNLSDEEESAIRDKIYGFKAEKFDKTPRAIMVEIEQFALETASQIAAKLDELQVKKDEFLAKYKPVDQVL